MANPNGTVANLIPFRPGQSGNPSGRPTGTRNKLQGDFLDAMLKVFEESGLDAMRRACKQNPLGFIRAVAGVSVPKQFELADPTADDELLQLLRARLEKRRAQAETPPPEGSEAA